MYVSPGKYTLCLKGSTTVPIKGVKCQITATFTVSTKAAFLPTQLIYQGVTERCLPKYKFPKEFNVTYTKNHWSNFEKCVDFFEKIILHYLRAKKIWTWISARTIFIYHYGHFKGYTTTKILNLCLENNCELVTVPDNLTNKFRSLDLTIKQKAKKFVSNQF